MCLLLIHIKVLTIKNAKQLDKSEAWNLEIIVQQYNKGHTVYEFRKVRAGNNNYNNNLLFIMCKIHVIYDLSQIQLVVFYQYCVLIG